MVKKLLRIFPLLFVLSAQSLTRIASAEPSMNRLILDVVKEMPNGGGYNNKAFALNLLKDSISIQDKNMEVHPEKAQPSFCSSATYLVFIKTLSQLQKNKRINLSTETQKQLLVLGAEEQPDGAGIWGRWNANGPGTARLFSELKLGRNFDFSKLAEAQPGDFMKIFWNDKIGADEKGHSVIFMGTKEVHGEKEICFWSSNSASQVQPAGMGTQCVSAKKVHRALFSRLEFPENLNQAAKLIGPGTRAYTDTYLHSLLKESSSLEEMRYAGRDEVRRTFLKRGARPKGSRYLLAFDEVGTSL